MTSSYRESCVQRHNERHTKGPIKPKPRVGNSKNTKKWCRGVRGRLHKPKCVPYQDMKNAGWAPGAWKVLVCTECGKELDYFMPNDWCKNPKYYLEQPAWVK